ncbi:hypothetical protein MYX77_06950 [Acidobacteriia bacterium AH_259_A11_L15]|nr:hypothetical protein [Acidobacteriia bacterium AH_259_A11_L15]
MRRLLLLLLPAFLFALLPALGETTRFWRQESFSEFEKGTADGVALRSDGELLLAPRHREVTDPNLEFIWSIAEGPAGTLYLGGGSPARVIAVDANEESRVVFESKELEVHALVVDPESGVLYLATSPDGSVYRLPPGGDATLLFEPQAKYLWDLVLHPDGTLYLATGDKGEIFRITPEGEDELFFSSEETHVRALALGPDGNLYAGTEPNGLVLRLSPAGEAFVLYEAARKEVTSLRFDSEGNLYVAAIGAKAKPPTAPTAPGQPRPGQTTTTITAAGVIVTATGAPRAVPTRLLPFLTAGGSDIFRIAPDGYPEELWSSQTELVYSLAFDAEGRLLAGTGNKGTLLAIDSPHLYTHLIKFSSQQITTLYRADASGRLYLGTANPGKLYAVGPELATEGTFESEVFDAELFSHWGRISWRNRSPNAPGSVELFSRSGNTSNPQKNWSPWSQAYTHPSGTQIASPPARFLQWRLVLRATDSRTPSLSGVSVAYLRRNVAPVVEKVIVQAPGIRVRGFPTAPQQNQSVQLERPPPPSRRVGRPGVVQVQVQQPPQRLEPPPQGTAEPGARSVLWSADDANDDDLVYSVYYRGEDETRWKLMAENLTERFFTWDDAALPDGAYFIRVIASDAPANPADLALSGENTSDRFEVDNTPPRIENLTAQSGSRTVEIRFLARDSYSSLKKAEYSLNAGEWQPLFPLSRTTDAREHTFVFSLEDLEPGEHTVVVRVYDRFDNPVLAKTTFVVK